jgi:hypothetical protein
MSNTNAFKVVSAEWEEEEKRSQTYGEFLELFYTRMERLDDARNAIERQTAQNMEARMRLREEALKQAAQAQKNDELFRQILPDMSDPVIKLIDSAIDFLNQLYTVAEQRPAFHPEMQVNMSELVSTLSISPAIIRSAMIGVTWPLESKITQLADLSLKRDVDIDKPNNTKQVEDDSSEDHDENPNNPA